MTSTLSVTASLGSSIESLDTPAVLVDLDKVDKNIRRMHDAVMSHGVAMRSHIKTHKSPRLAERQLEAGAIGIASAKLSEAEAFVAAGCDDVVIAYPIYGPQKWSRAAELAKRTRLTVHVENLDAAAGLDKAAGQAGVELQVRMEIDSGFHRCGVMPDQALQFARSMTAFEHLRLEGITTHRSAFFPDAGGRPSSVLGLEEGEMMVRIAEELRADGFEVPVVAGGSSPTSPTFAEVPGITEAVAGTYVFYDEGMSEIGVCERDDIALSLLCSVVSIRGRRVVLDGGSKTFSKDSYFGKPGLFGKAATGSGIIESVTEEHGVLQLGPDDPLPALGAKIECRPMHVCPVVNLTDVLIGHRDRHVVEVFEVSARGQTR